MESVEALYVPEGDRYVASVLTQGPWSPDLQFGGAPAALVAHVVEGVESPVPMRVARLTVDLMRPVPIAPISVEWEVRRPGRRIQIVDVSLIAGGTEVVRASALRMRIADLTGVNLPPGQPAPPGPPEVPLRPYRAHDPGSRPGTGGALEYAYARPDGMFEDPTWTRLRVPVVAGRPLAPLERMAYVADSVSGFGHPVDEPVTGINADVSLSVVRYAEGDWICLTGEGWTGVEGIGVARATMWDHLGVVGSATLSRLVDREEKPT